MNDSNYVPGDITTRLYSQGNIRRRRFVIFLLISANDNKSHGSHIIVDLAIKDIRFYAW